MGIADSTGLLNASRQLQRYASNKVFVCLLVCIVGSAYVAAGLKQGWIAFDDGALAHTAQRILAGEMPHRDFDDPYTGGLTYANALAFRILGTNLGTLRLVLFAFTLLWIAATFYITSRFSAPLTAGALTLLALAWGVPNYPAAMPSWYNLFFATFGCAAVFRYLEGEQRVWLFIAGVCGGLSVLVKIAGFYFLIALVVFAAYWEQSRAIANLGPSARKLSAYSLALAAFVVWVTLAVYSLIHRCPGIAEVLHFVVPGGLLGTVLLQREWLRRGFASRERFEKLLQFMLPVATGALLPITLFAAPYVLWHAVGNLYRGLFVLPLLRLTLAAYAAPSLETFSPAVVLALLFAMIVFAKNPPRAMSVLMLWITGIVLLYLSTFSRAAFAIVFFSARNLVPLLVLLSVAVLLKGRSVREQQLMLLCSVSAFCGLVQFPYSNAIYFFYVAPLVVLTVGSLLSRAGRRQGLLSCAALMLYGCFAVLALTPWARAGNTHVGTTQPVRMNIERADGIEINPIQAHVYDKLVELVRRHSRGSAIYVTPSSPEVYFLADMRNPTRTIFDTFDSTDGRVANISKQLLTAGVNVVVINEGGEYPGPSGTSLQSRLRSDFPNSEKIAGFDVRWKQ